MRGTEILHSDKDSMPAGRRKTKCRKRRSQRGGTIFGPQPKDILLGRHVALDYGRQLQQRGGGFMEAPMRTVRPYHRRRCVYMHSLMT